MIELSVNNDLEGVWASFEILHVKLPLGCEENHEELSGYLVTEGGFERCLGTASEAVYSAVGRT